MKHLLFTAALAFGLAGCSNSTPTISSGNVQYGDSTAAETLTNQFGSTDMQTIAETMARSLAQWAAGQSQRPLVTIADVKNRTDEYIDTQSITDSIRVQLLKSGTMRFATDIAGMQNQTDELVRQTNTGLYQQDTAAKLGRMKGAQYRIEGSISSIVKQTDNVKDVYYSFSLIATSIEDGTIEWADEKDIRKTSVN